MSCLGHRKSETKNFFQCGAMSHREIMCSGVKKQEGHVQETENQSCKHQPYHWP
jgi:hypothetical protein